MPAHIPEGFQAVVPYLHIADASGFADFLKTVFGATVRMMHTDDEGRVVHGEMVLAGCVVEFSEATEAFSAITSALHVFVEDPDATYARALEAGATSVYELTDHEYGERSGGVRDAWGNSWYIAAVTNPAARNAPPEQ